MHEARTSRSRRVAQRACFVWRQPPNLELAVRLRTGSVRVGKLVWRESVRALSVRRHSADSRCVCLSASHRNKLAGLLRPTTSAPEPRRAGRFIQTASVASLALGAAMPPSRNQSNRAKDELKVAGGEAGRARLFWPTTRTILTLAPDRRRRRRLFACVLSCFAHLARHTGPLLFARQLIMFNERLVAQVREHSSNIRPAFGGLACQPGSSGGQFVWPNR